MLIAAAEIAGRAPLDVRIEATRVLDVAPHLDRREDEPVVEARGGALLPGLHDHHIHLFALAAAARSVPCGPPRVADANDLAAALAGAVAGEDGWIRGVGYHESVAGELDRASLDALVDAVPARVQHRSGALWILNSRALDALRLDRGVDAQGVERDAAGRATGRLFRLDTWLREQLGPQGPPDLADVGRRLARFGVTGVTDASVGNALSELRAFEAALESGALPQRLRLLGAQSLPESRDASIRRGAVKLLVDERALPLPDALEACVARAHDAGRPVAVHCVTRAELVVALAALRGAGSLPGDRIEHAGVAPPELAAQLALAGATVVTQPHFIRERGDAYARDVEPRDRPWLYRAAGLLEAGVRLAGGSDAPFGDPDPWRAMRAAVDRKTESGAVLGGGEALSPERALALFTTPDEDPGGPPRRVAPGEPADLCLLDRPWAEARERLSGADVRVTLRDGRPIWRAGAGASTL